MYGNVSNSSGLWNDLPCSQQLDFVCSLPATHEPEVNVSMAHPGHQRPAAVTPPQAHAQTFRGPPPLSGRVRRQAPTRVSRANLGRTPTQVRGVGALFPAGHARSLRRSARQAVGSRPGASESVLIDCAAPRRGRGEHVRQLRTGDLLGLPDPALRGKWHMTRSAVRSESAAADP